MTLDLGSGTRQRDGTSGHAVDRARWPSHPTRTRQRFQRATDRSVCVCNRLTARRETRTMSAAITRRNPAKQFESSYGSRVGRR